MAKSAPRFRWTFTYVRGWEGHRLGERIVKPERGYHEYEFVLRVGYVSGVPCRWHWLIENFYLHGTEMRSEYVGRGHVDVDNYDGPDLRRSEKVIESARERAMREAEVAYVSNPWRAELR